MEQCNAHVSALCSAHALSLLRTDGPKDKKESCRAEGSACVCVAKTRQGRGVKERDKEEQKRGRVVGRMSGRPRCSSGCLESLLPLLLPLSSRLSLFVFSDYGARHAPSIS